MWFRLTGVAGAICLTFTGCATKQYASHYASRAAAAIERTFADQGDARMWREQKERQQRIAREAGRIGYIGNAGPALGTSSGPSVSFN